MLTPFRRIPSDPSRCLVSIPTQTQMTKFIAKGGFGSVYSYLHPIDGKEYAVKRIRIRSPQEQLTAFREIQLLSCLFHPRIIRYHTSWLEEEQDNENSRIHSESSSSSVSLSMETSRSDSDRSPQWLGNYVHYVLCCQMEYCSSTLSEYLEFRQDHDRNREIQMQKEIMEGVDYLHFQNIIHGDLTPKNILLTYNGQIKLSDFGLSIFHQQSISDQQIAGRSLYQAPELDHVSDLRPFHPSLDLYNIGLIFMEINQLFKTRMEMIHCFRVLRKHPDQLSPFSFLRSYVLRHIQKDPLFRISSTQSLHFITLFQKIYQECECIVRNELCFFPETTRKNNIDDSFYLESK